MFEPEKLHFNFIDLLGAPRRALKGKKIWTHLMGLIVGYPVYAILTYLAFWIDGQSLAATWDRFGLYPFFIINSSQLSSITAWVVYAVGVLFWLLATLLAATVVARITYKELKGDPFYTISNGVAFTKRHWRTVIFSPVAVVLIILFFMAIAVIMALIGKIPFFGELVFVGFYPLYFAGAIFVLYTVVVLAVLIWYLPAVLALWEEDAIGSTFQAYAIAWNQAWRVVIYSTLVAALAAVSTFLYGCVITAGYHFINWIFGASWLMAAKLEPIIAWAEKIVFSGYCNIFYYIPGQGAWLSPLAAGINLADVSGWQAFIGSILAVILLLIYGSVFAYGLSVISVGQSLSFLIFKLKTDDENLLERKDEEDLEAEAEEKVESGVEAGEEAPSQNEEDQGTAEL